MSTFDVRRRVRKTSAFDLPYSITAGEIIKLLESIPSYAQVSFHETKADRPGESSSHSISASWSEDVVVGKTTRD